MTPDADWTIHCNSVKYGAIVAAARWNRLSKAQTSDRIQHDVLRWGFELPRRLPRRLLCSWMACLIVWRHCTYFSEECTASIFTAEEYAMPSAAVAKCIALWDLLQPWRTKQRAPTSSWCVVACVHGVTSQKRVYVFQYTHSDWRVMYQWWALLFSFSERESIGLYWGTGPDDPIIGHPEVNLCMFRSHSFAFRPECRMCCLCRQQNRRLFTVSKSVSTLYHFCHSLLYKSQQSVIVR